LLVIVGNYLDVNLVKHGRRSMVALLLLFSACSSSTIIAPGSSFHSQTPEQKFEIIVNDTNLYHGTALRVEVDSVLWLSDSLQLWDLPRSRVKAVRFKDTKAGSMYGLLWGGTIGYVSGFVFAKNRYEKGENAALVEPVFGLAGALRGALVGGLIGGSLGYVHNYVLNDSSKTSEKQNRTRRDTK
jgi:hypothetical protein